MIAKDEGWDLDPVVVRWVDAVQGNPGWEDINTLQPLNLLSCTTVGFVLSEDDTALVLAETVGDAEVQGRIVIPKGAITDIKRPWRKRKAKRGAR